MKLFLLVLLLVSYWTVFERRFLRAQLEQQEDVPLTHTVLNINKEESFFDSPTIKDIHGIPEDTGSATEPMDDDDEDEKKKEDSPSHPTVPFTIQDLTDSHTFTTTHATDSQGTTLPPFPSFAPTSGSPTPPEPTLLWNHSSFTQEQATFPQDKFYSFAQREEESTFLDVFGDVAKIYLTHSLIPPTDVSCRWDWRYARCEPHCNCSFQFLWGDYHMGRSCRLRSIPDEKIMQANTNWYKKDRNVMRQKVKPTTESWDSTENRVDGNQTEDHSFFHHGKQDFGKRSPDTTVEFCQDPPNTFYTRTFRWVQVNFETMRNQLITFGVQSNQFLKDTLWSRCQDVKEDICQFVVQQEQNVPKKVIRRILKCS